MKDDVMEKLARHVGDMSRQLKPVSESKIGYDSEEKDLWDRMLLEMWRLEENIRAYDIKIMRGEA